MVIRIALAFDALIISMSCLIVLWDNARPSSGCASSREIPHIFAGFPLMVNTRPVISTCRNPNGCSTLPVLFSVDVNVYRIGVSEVHRSALATLALSAGGISKSGNRRQAAREARSIRPRSPLSRAVRTARTESDPSRVQRIPACFNLCPTTILHADSTGPLPIIIPLAS